MLSLPTQFGPYLLLERVSVGGMAEIYKAREYGVEGFERTVAVKRILPHVAEDDEFIAMFKDEAKIAVQLSHGNIAQIYNLGNEQDSFYIALEFVHGRDLRAIFQKCQQQGRPMPVSQACYVIMKICEGLDYAHNAKDKFQRDLNIVHRDVSPPNILVSFEGEVKLIDFGVAKAAGRASRTQAGILKGKFGYMSPEQVRGMPIDRRSDVFSVGVVLFEMLTGQRLFQAETDFATLERVRAVDVPRPSSLNPDIPRPLENIMYKALAGEPEERYQAAIELHDELQAFMFAQGLFYSRKDLAAWMHHQYGPEIEAEKARDRAHNGNRPGAAPSNSGSFKKPTRKTMVMAGEPPPPPNHPLHATVVPSTSTAVPPAPKRVKRKTLVMTTSSPNLPPPPGVRASQPVQPVAPPPTASRPVPVPERGGSAPDRPPVSRVPERPSATVPVPPPRAARPSGPIAPPPSQVIDDSLDWDDDELETRLFEGDDSQAPSRSSGVAPRVASVVRSERVDPAASTPGSHTVPVSSPFPASAPGPSSPFQSHPLRSGPQQSGPHASGPLPSGPFQAGIAPSSPFASPSGPATPASSQVGAASLPFRVEHQARSTPFDPAPNLFPPQPATAASSSWSLGQSPSAAPSPALLGGPLAPAQPSDYEPRARSSAGLVFGMLTIVAALAGAGVALYLWIDRPATPAATEVATAQVPVPAARGALTVQTKPADAVVAVDGARVSGESPFVVADLEPGKHQIAISKEGYLPLEREVDVGTSPLALEFALEHKDVMLVLQSEPAGAAMNLLVDGRATPMGSAGSQYKLTRQPGAEYEVEAIKEGFISQRVPLEFSGESTQKVQVTLVRDKTIAVAPDEDDEDEERRPRRSTSKPKPKRSEPASARPTPPPPADEPPKPVGKTAELRIGTNAGVQSAKVYVDGNFAGNTPLPSVKVAPGKHVVEFQWSDGRRLRETVVVADGGSKVVKGG